MDMGRLQRRFMEVRLDKATGEISRSTKERFTTIIENAMALGQTKTVLGLLKEGIHFQTYPEHTTGRRECVKHMWTHANLNMRSGDPVTIQVNRQLNGVFAWLIGKGVHYCFTSVMVDEPGFVVDFDPVLANFVLITAFFLPEDTQLRDTPGALLSLWNDVRTPKCVDSSMIPGWTERIIKCVRAGITHVVLCTLREHGDFDEIDPRDAHEDAFACIGCRDHLTMASLTNVADYESPSPSWVLDRRFVDMVQWVKRHHWSWTLCFGTAPLSEGRVRISQWAYFTVLLDPLTTTAYK